MGLELRWAGDGELDRVAETRLLCYGAAEKDRERYLERLRNDPRGKAGDYLLAEMDGRSVGTATSFSLRMWVRGTAIPCQGVAWVGAIKTMRRRGGDSSQGVASAVMREMLRMARERGDVVTALMPFRASFYEHFGYGTVERRNDWTVPLSILPTGDFSGIRFYEPADFTARAECLRRVNRAGQCDPERSDAYWHALTKAAEEGLSVVDRPAANGPVHGSMYLVHQHVNGKDVLRVAETIYEDAAALQRQLYFLASLRDQYASVQMVLPADLRLNWWLKESQLEHRPVNHATASVKPQTRMQVRVLDHKKFLESLHLPPDIKGAATVEVQECDGAPARFRVEINGGRAEVEPTHATPDFACPDRVWAAVACGDLSASEAVRLKLGRGNGERNLLDFLARGPAPFSNEYF